MPTEALGVLVPSKPLQSKVLKTGPPIQDLLHHQEPETLCCISCAQYNVWSWVKLLILFILFCYLFLSHLLQAQPEQRFQSQQIICICADICTFPDLHYRHEQTSAPFDKLPIWSKERGAERTFPLLGGHFVDIFCFFCCKKVLFFGRKRPLLCGGSVLLSRHEFCRIYALFWSDFDADF